MKKFNKLISGALAALMIFTSVPIYAVNDVSTGTNTEISTETEGNTSEIISDSTEETSSSPETEVTETQNIEDRPTVFLDGEEDLEENDNWELSTVFYDSTVDNGKTPLTSIDWDASDGSYLDGDARIITVQINYRNTNTATTYKPQELEIQIPNLAYNTDAYKKNTWEEFAQWSSKITISANYGTNINYNWDFITGESPTVDQSIFSLVNNKTIEEKANFEGNIQIIYEITPLGEDHYQNLYDKYIDLEKGAEECTHNYSTTLKSNLNYNNKKLIESNSLNFNYTRTYIHPWQKKITPLEKEAYPLDSLDALGDIKENPDDYIWVKYRMKDLEQWADDFSYPYMYPKNTMFIIDEFPEECLVYKDGKKQTPINGNTYKLEGYNFYEQISNRPHYYLDFYVGYPKSVYNEENDNLIITNYAEKWGKYPLESEPEKMGDDTVSLNLNDFKFDYTGELYSISKWHNTNGRHYYQNFNSGDNRIGSGNTTPWGMRFTIKNMFREDGIDVKFGDDIICVPDKNNEYKIISDNEYYFSKASFGKLVDGAGGELTNKHTIELWIRRAGNEDYELYETFTTPKYSKTYSFTEEDAVVGYYFLIKNVKTDLKLASYYSHETNVVIKGINDLYTTGKLYNFNYLEVYHNGELHNTVDLDSYVTQETKNVISTYDIEKYGHYIQRGVGNISYTYYQNPKLDYEIWPSKDMTLNKNDSVNKYFYGNATIRTRINSEDAPDASVFLEYAGETLNDSDGIKGFEMMDLLPVGMELIETPTLNKEKSISSSDNIFYDKNKNELDINDVLELIQENTIITITNNWVDANGNNTNRTHIHIKTDLSNNPIYILTHDNDIWGDALAIFYDYNFKISYDSYLEYGGTVKNNLYSNWLNNRFSYTSFEDRVSDTGSKDAQEKDINKNGNTSETMSFVSDTITISTAISTHQDVQTQVSSTLSNYSTGIVNAEYDKNYSYKLRVRSGENDVTNLVIYDNLEKWAKDKDGNFIEAAGKKQYWQGEFLGIDTSYAESKGYNVKVWYSENEKAGTLGEDSSWKEFISSALVPDNTKTEIVSSPNWPSNYNNNMTESNNYWEKTFEGADAIQITFDSTSKLESATYDYLRFYDRDGNNITNDIFGITAGKIGGSDLAGKTVTVPGNYIKITMRTDSSGLYKGFSANITPAYNSTPTDPNLVKSLAFQYLDSEGNPAILPANSLTYVEINMKAPADESIKTLAYNGCWTQWNAIDEFGKPVDFITGINSNIVKVALPNSVIENEIPSIQLKIEKEIQGTTEAFENMLLDPNGEYQFMISLVKQEENEDGSHDVINGVISNKKGLVIKDLSYGTWVISETDDIYFDFVDMIAVENPEIMTPGVTFEKTDAGYILTIDEDIDSATEYSLKVINEIEPERFYEDKESEVNLFKGAPLIEEQSLLDKLIEFFK